ncbi:MAG: hypothetical protein V4591_03875 [Bdellovibrionota bacterium]
MQTGITSGQNAAKIIVSHKKLCKTDVGTYQDLLNQIPLGDLSQFKTHLTTYIESLDANRSNERSITTAKNKFVDTLTYTTLSSIEKNNLAELIEHGTKHTGLFGQVVSTGPCRRQTNFEKDTLAALELKQHEKDIQIKASGGNPSEHSLFPTTLSISPKSRTSVAATSSFSSVQSSSQSLQQEPVTDISDSERAPRNQDLRKVFEYILENNTSNSTNSISIENGDSSWELKIVVAATSAVQQDIFTTLESAMVGTKTQAPKMALGIITTTFTIHVEKFDFLCQSHYQPSQRSIQIRIGQKTNCLSLE